MNLSCKNLAEEQIKILSGGLKFLRTLRDVDKSQLKLGVEEFKTKIRLKWYFRGYKSNNDDSFSSSYANIFFQTSLYSITFSTYYICKPLSNEVVHKWLVWYNKSLMYYL